MTGTLHLKSAMARRAAAFEEAMQEIGLSVPAEMIVAAITLEGRIRALAELAVLRERPTAIMCSNDITATGVMREAYEYGMAIPKELSVVGFDDIRLSRFTISAADDGADVADAVGEFAFKDADERSGK